MNRSERRKADSIKRKIKAMNPAARELAIQTGMELQDALASERKQEMLSLLEKEWASKRNELYKRISEEQANRFAERLAELDRKAREYQTAVTRWRKAYLTTWLAGFASAEPPQREGGLTSTEAIDAAIHEFKDRLKIIEGRVDKDVAHFNRPELLYGVLRWLATTYHGAKTGVKCPDLDASCRRASGFRYAGHQSEVTMGQHKSDYEIIWRDKVVKLKEHVGFGTNRDPRHTIRLAFFFDNKTKMVVVGYIGLHQPNRAT